MATTAMPCAARPLEPDAIQTALPVWAAAADDGDHVALALRLLAALEDDREDPQTLAVTRARLLLLARRPDEALAELSSHQITQVSGDEHVSWPNLVLAACSAATGDQTAFRWLLWAGSVTAGTAMGWRVAYLVAAAATHIGAQAVADQAWRRLVVDYQIVTGRTVAEFSAVETALRDRQDLDTAVEAVARSSRNFTHLSEPVSQDPSPVLLAAERLGQRGDSAGARLLLTAMVRVHSAKPALDGALKLLTPGKEMRRYKIKAGALVALSALLLPLGLIPPLGLIGVLIIFGGRRVWNRWMTVPGLNRTDSQTWRAFNSLRYDQRTGAPRVTNEINVSRVLGAVVGVLLGIVLATLVAVLGAHVLRLVTSAPASPVAVTSLWFLIFGGTIAAALSLVRIPQERSSRRRRARDEAVRERRQEAMADQCHCWQASVLNGRFSQAYLSRHLVAVDEGPEVASLEGRVGTGVKVGQCPSTGALWIAAPLGSSAGPLLLRGPLPSQQAKPSEPNGHGFYL